MLLIIVILEFYTIRGDMEEFKKKNYIRENFELILKALSPTEYPEQYHFEISNRVFTLTKVELIEDDDTYEKIYLRVPNLKKVELTEEAMEIVLRQMEDVGIVCDKSNQQSHLITGLRNNYEKLNQQYAGLVDEKDHLEEQVVEKCLELINEKKKFIDERLNEAYKNPNDSSFDMRDFVINGGLKASSTDESNDALRMETLPIKPKKEKPSPIASTSTAAALTTPKSVKQSTPIKHKRTPSKKLFAQTQEQDSDDFDVIPLINEKTSSSPRKRKSNQDTSSIFSNFKRTPKKSKCDREEKESSVELKKDNKSDSHQNYISSSPAPSDKSVENAQRLEASRQDASHSSDVFKTAKNNDNEDDLMQFTQEFDMDVEPILPKRRSQRKAAAATVTKSSQKNPYSAETINYLDT